MAKFNFIVLASLIGFGLAAAEYEEGANGN